jgi:hypothetical protein
MIGISRDEIFQNGQVHPFWPPKEWRIFGKVEIRLSQWETKEMQIKLAMKCNKNEPQQDAKSNAEVLSKWMKMTWKTFEDVIRQAKTGLSKPNLWWMLMMTMEKGIKRVTLIKWMTLSTFSANSSLHFMGTKFRERHSLTIRDGRCCKKYNSGTFLALI